MTIRIAGFPDFVADLADLRRQRIFVTDATSSFSRRREGGMMFLITSKESGRKRHKEIMSPRMAVLCRRRPDGRNNEALCDFLRLALNFVSNKALPGRAG
ncbi:MAG TPA: hypothetical protein VMB34_17335 [Acetobacteraceae bacterium]|nr:hypothetical protein [Acetobacteraceae bacterium]